MRRLLVLAVLFLALYGCAGEGEAGEGSASASAPAPAEGEGEAEAEEAPMEEEKRVLYAAIESFVGKGWNGSGLFPDPCGQTPIQGVSCDLFNGLWYPTVVSIGPVLDNSLQCAPDARFSPQLFDLRRLKSLPTVVSIGPVLDNSLQCAPDARFSPQLFDLRRLKSLSFYACFPATNPTAIPANNWEKLAGSLETLEFRTNPGLNGAIPASLGRLAGLQSLVLVENNLTGAVPAELGGLAKLRRLVLSGNGLSGPVPATLGNGLHDEPLIVDMSKNYLTGSLPPSLGGLKGLLKMDLSNNLLEGSIPPEFTGLESLTLLDLRNNSLTGGLPEFVHGMAALQDLLLSNNPLGGALMRSGWEKLASLATLDLSNAGLVGSIPESMAAMARLRFLALDHNHLSGAVPARLAALPSIGAMYLNGNNLTGALEFSAGFYQRMGSRFASWDNPGLCYSGAAAATGDDTPTGVAVCKDAQEPTSVGVRDRVDGSGRKPETSSSLPASSSAVMGTGLWCLVLIQWVVVLLLL